MIPSEPFTGVLEAAEKKPLALSDANRSFGAFGAWGCDAEIGGACCWGSDA